MAAVVSKSYLRQHSRVRFTNNLPVEAFEGFFVTGLTPGPGAVADIIGATNLPVPWTAHPRFSQLFVADYEPEMVRADAAIVVVKYVSLAAYVNVQSIPAMNIRGGCGLVVKQTDTDIDKVPILLSNQNLAASPPVTADDRKVGPCIVNVLRPQQTLIIERIRPAMPFANGVDPLALQATYGGKVNEVMILGAEPRTLMCEAISFSAEGMLGVAWKMEYEFRYDPDTHNPRVSWVNRDTGQPGTDLVKAPGYDLGTPSVTDDPQYGRKVIKEYREIDFTPLLA